MDYEKLITDLIDCGWSSTNNFLSPEICQQLILEINSLSLVPARVGRGQMMQLQQEVRNDAIYWLQASSPSPLQKHYLAAVDKVREALNSSLYLGLKQFEGHFARYESQGFYKKHLDQFIGNSERLISIITYLNTPESGGELRLYKRDLPDEVDCDLLPKEGTMVCFLSNQIYHEVLPTQSTRYSITGWLRTTIA